MLPFRCLHQACSCRAGSQVTGASPGPLREKGPRSGDPQEVWPLGRPGDGWEGCAQRLECRDLLGALETEGRASPGHLALPEAQPPPRSV